MATLNDEVKTLIVRRLACFDTPKQASDAVKEEFGIAVSPQQCEAYDPGKAAGKALSKKWRETFEAARQTFIAQLGNIPIANRAVRLKMLDRMAHRAESQGNSVAAAQLIEQAAKEVGGAFTNRQRVEHTGADGAPIKAAVAQISVPPAEYQAIVKRLLDEY